MTDSRCEYCGGRGVIVVQPLFARWRKQPAPTDRPCPECVEEEEE